MGIMVYSLLWVMQDFDHQQNCGCRAKDLGLKCLIPPTHPPTHPHQEKLTPCFKKPLYQPLHKLWFMRVTLRVPKNICIRVYERGLQTNVFAVVA